jgi:Ca2+-binding RTX toxin-like protein
MLGLMGLFGILMAGFAADALMSSAKSTPDGEEPDPSADPGDTSESAAGHHDILTWLGVDADAASNPGPDDPDFVPHSDDLPPEQVPDLAVVGGGGSDILSAGSGNDTLIGNDGDDQLAARGGDDFIQGGNGADSAYGGAGDDTVQGGVGNDLLVGEDGRDKLVGGAGDDSLLGQNGDDSLFGGAGSDTLIGGAGNDGLVAGDGEDWLAGGLGDDSLIGDAGSDTLDGGAGNDVIDGREAATAFPEMDFLNGGDGDDTLILGAGDYATGGDGADWFELPDLAIGDPIANIADFDAQHDSLIVVFDPTMHPDPQLTLESPDNSKDVMIVLDGVPLAMVQGGAGMTLADVMLTPAEAA